MDEFLDIVFVMTQMSIVVLQRRFPVIQVDPMFQVGSVCRGFAQIANLESLLVDWERVNIFHFDSTLLLEILQSHLKNSSFLVNLALVK